MSSKKNRPKLVIILGPTAAGKSALAITLAKKYDGEIVSADSRSIYRSMDIGTGKPTATERAAVRHHLINISPPQTVITLADWQRRAYAAIDAILKRNKNVFLVGGTGLYLSSIIEGYTIPQKKQPPRYVPLIIGIAVARQTLYRRINARVRRMVRSGLETEARALARRIPWTLPAMHSIGYREWRAYFEGRATKHETIAAIQQASRNFAKRQMTWFRGMERRGVVIHWLQSKRSAESLVKNFLEKKQGPATSAGPSHR